MTTNEYERLMSEACDKLTESQMEVGRLRTALEAVLNYSNDPSVVKMVEYVLAQGGSHMTDLDKELDNAMQVVNNLSKDARAAGEKNLMYAANRAWHNLSDARELIHQNRATAQKSASALGQGEH